MMAEEYYDGAYTGEEIDAAVAAAFAAAPQSTTYNKDEVDTALAAKANTADLGTAAEADTTTSITEGGTGVPTAGSVYTDQIRQDSVIGSLVDRGAKNLTDWGGGTADAGNSYVVQNYPIGLKAGVYSVSIESAIDNGRGEFSFKNASGVTVGSGTIEYNGGRAVTTATLSADAVKFHFYTLRAGSFTNPMICTKKDYEASPIYQPYAPTNRELYEMILALQSGT